MKFSSPSKVAQICVGSFVIKNSISQMNSVSCEHSSLIPQEKKGPPPEEGQEGPEKRPPDEGKENKH